ncbi:MAG: PaaI family thioesterase [Rhizobiales bacterium]|nr:PaaI family thioesterase [Hyphomicrobiales bacterium]
MQPETTLDPAIEAKVRASFAAQSAMRTIGARLASVRPGAVEIELPAADHINQQQGFAHGGVIGMILDSACGYASFTTMPLDCEVVSIEYKINFLRPAVGERFVARGRVTRPGRTVAVAQGEVVAVTNGAEQTVAVMLATMAVVKAPA